MTKSKVQNPTFILELKLLNEEWIKDILNKRFGMAEKLYNITLSYALKQYKLMKESKKYRQSLHLYRSVNAKLKRTKQETKISLYRAEKVVYQNELNAIRLSFGLSEYGLHAYIKKHQNNVKKHIDSLTAQKIASEVWQAMEEVIFKGAKAHFKKYGTMTSVEGKTNKSGIRFRDHHIHWIGLKIPVNIRKNDLFAQEALSSHKIKYCRLVRKVIHGKQQYYVQLVMSGLPPVKRVNSTGAFRHLDAPNKRVGIDIGTSTVAVSSEKEVFLQPLASNVPLLEAEKRRLLRKLDRSRRKTNPQNFNADGTVKRGIKLTWNRSQNYYKTLFKLKEISRKKVAYVKEQHSKVANRLLVCGNEVYVEMMNFKALAKRSKETKINAKGKFQRKKRFGKSIGNYAPAKLLGILNQKLGYLQTKLHEVNTKTFKASQYNHVTNTFKKKKLHQRWSRVGNHLVQRDLYSAFLLMNSDVDEQHTNEALCHQTFDQFIQLHNEQIKQIKQSNDKLPSSIGINKAG